MPSSSSPRPGASRTVALSDFFTAYRKTLLSPGEVILEVVVPRFDPGRGVVRRSDFLKVSKRRELDISIVAAAFSVDADAGGVVRRARMAYGGVAATPLRARRAEAALEGRTLSEAAAGRRGRRWRASSSRSTTCAGARSTGAG